MKYLRRRRRNETRQELSLSRNEIFMIFNHKKGRIKGARWSIDNFSSVYKIEKMRIRRIIRWENFRSFSSYSICWLVNIASNIQYTECDDGMENFTFSKEKESFSHNNPINLWADYLLSILYPFFNDSVVFFAWIFFLCLQVESWRKVLIRVKVKSSKLSHLTIFTGFMRTI